MIKILLVLGVTFGSTWNFIESLEPLGILSDHSFQQIELQIPEFQNYFLRIATWNVLGVGNFNLNRGYLNNPFDLIELPEAWIKRKTLQYTAMFHHASKNDIALFFLQETDHNGVMSLAFHNWILPKIQSLSFVFGFHCEFSPLWARNMITCYHINTFSPVVSSIIPCSNKRAPLWEVILYCNLLKTEISFINMHLYFGDNEFMNEMIKSLTSRYIPTIVGGDANYAMMENFLHSGCPTRFSDKDGKLRPLNESEYFENSIDGFFASNIFSLNSIVGRTYIIRQWDERGNAIEIYDVVYDKRSEQRNWFLLGERRDGITKVSQEMKNDNAMKTSTAIGWDIIL